MNMQIDTAIKRARGYWFVDGFTEMAAGGWFILLAGILLFSVRTPQALSPAWLLSVAGQIAFAKLIGFLAVILILWWLKDHFTYPRTGFVRGKRVTAAHLLIMLRNAILFMLLPIIGLFTASLLIASADSVLSSMAAWFPVGLGIIWAVVCVLAGEWMGIRRFRLVGSMILLAGIAVGIWQWTSGLPDFPANVQPGILQPPMLEIINRTLVSLSVLTLVSGLILLFSGVATFLRYRKENPTPYPEGV